MNHLTGFLLIFLSTFEVQAADHTVSTRGIVYSQKDGIIAALIQGTDAIQFMDCASNSTDHPALPDSNGKPTEDYIHNHCLVPQWNPELGIVKSFYQANGNRFVLAASGITTMSIPGHSNSKLLTSPTPIPMSSIISSTSTFTLNLSDVSTLVGTYAFIIHTSGENPQIESNHFTAIKATEATFMYSEITSKVIQQ